MEFYQQPFALMQLIKLLAHVGHKNGLDNLLGMFLNFENE